MARPITSVGRLSRALLARTGARVRQTDWWAVAIEIAVVVLGIIIAFQLNEWDQRRQKRQESKAILQHLREETAGDIASIAAIHAQHVASARNYAMLIAALNDPGRAAAYRALGESGCNLLRMPAVRYHSMGGLEAGERSDAIDDPQLRHLIRRADAERAFNDRQLDFFRDSFHRYGDVLERHIRWRVVGNNQIECSVDVDGLRGDAAAVGLLPKADRDQQRFGDYRARELAAVRAVADRARCLQTGTCATN